MTCKFSAASPPAFICPFSTSTITGSFEVKLTSSVTSSSSFNFTVILSVSPTVMLNEFLDNVSTPLTFTLKEVLFSTPSSVTFTAVVPDFVVVIVPSFAIVIIPSTTGSNFTSSVTSYSSFSLTIICSLCLKFIFSGFGTSVSFFNILRTPMTLTVNSVSSSLPSRCTVTVAVPVFLVVIFPLSTVIMSSSSTIYSTSSVTSYMPSSMTVTLSVCLRLTSKFSIIVPSFNTVSLPVTLTVNVASFAPSYFTVTNVVPVSRAVISPFSTVAISSFSTSYLTESVTTCPFNVTTTLSVFPIVILKLSCDNSRVGSVGSIAVTINILSSFAWS